MRSDLPAGWAEATLDDIAHINPPGAATSVPDDQAVSFVPMAAVQELTGRMDTSITRPFGEVKKGFTRFRDGDVLFAKITPCMENGKIAVARGLREGVGCGSTEFHVLRPNGAALPEYLRYYLVQSAFRRDAQREMQGAVGQQRVPTDFLRESKMPLAPLPEQQRIVSRIEELFSEIDNGERALERVSRLVERYRQSVLKAAVTGELTREWRESGMPPQAGQGSARFATDTIGTLPDGWGKCRIDEVGEVQLGRQRSPEHHQGEHMRPYLRVANVFEERIDTSDLMSMNFTPEEFERFRLGHGDILLNEGQSKELVGRPAMYRGELPDGCFTNSLVRFRCGERVLPAFALTVFLHFMKSGDFQRIARVTTNIAHLGAGRFAEMAFPVPPLEEQRRIVDSVAQQDSMWRAVAAEIGVRRRQSSALRQSILKAAFSGQLVPQDPADEPASALLARLAAQASDAPATPRRRGRPAGRRLSQPNPEVAD